MSPLKKYHQNRQLDTRDPDYDIELGEADADDIEDAELVYLEGLEEERNERYS